MITTSGESWSQSQVVRKYNVITFSQLYQDAKEFLDDNNGDGDDGNMLLLCFTVKYFFYIPPVLVV
jgi:hypothetical protein